MVRPTFERVRAQHADNFGWALACCGWERELAEEVLQEAYLRVLDGRARFDGRAALRTWFFAVIRRVAAEQHRAQWRRRMLHLRIARAGSAAGEPAACEAVPPHVATEREQRNLQLRGALMQLPLRQREVLHLVFYAELTLEEAARTLDITVGSARTHYHRGKLRLAKLLEREAENGGFA